MSPTRRRIIAAAVLTALCAAAVPPLAQAQTFPSKRFTFYVASTAGGSLDIMARLFADQLRKKTDQAILVENRPGGNDTLAMGAMVAAPADGHSMVISGNHIAHLFVKSVPYELPAITPVTILAQTPFTIVASKSSNLKNISEFVAHAKANPGKLTQGAVAGLHALEMYAAQFALGFQANVIPYKGFAPLETAVMSGEVDSSIFGNLAKVKSGQITAIVTAGDKRNPDIADVPTFKELGISYEPRASYSVWARGDTPPDLLERVNREAQELVQSPDWTERITKGFGIPPVGSTREVARNYMTREFQSYKAVAERTGIKPQ